MLLKASLTIFKKAPAPVGECPDIGIGVSMEELRVSQKVGVHGSEVVDLPVVVLEIAVGGRGHRASHVASNKEHVVGRIEHPNFWAIEHLEASHNGTQ